MTNLLIRARIGEEALERRQQLRPVLGLIQLSEQRAHVSEVVTSTSIVIRALP